MAALERVGVLGAGVMGSEIGQVAASSGRAVVLVDVDAGAIERGLAHIRQVGERRVARGRMSAEEADAIAGRIQPSLDAGALAGCDVVIEAAPEVLAVKREVFRLIDSVADPDALLASNTSGLSITAIARETTRPERVIGLHFFNPASVMRLVEVIRGDDTDEAAMAEGVAFSSAIGKTPVRVRECPGFLVNRILVRALVEAYRHAEEIGADMASADAAVTDGGPAPMGPFALGDLIGLDTTLHVQRDLETAYGERFAAGGMLAAQVSAGRLGQKSGGGFLVGAEPGPVDDHGAAIAARYYLGAFDEACRCLEEEIGRLTDIDVAMQLGAGWTAGPLAHADSEGLTQVAARLDAAAETAGERFVPRRPLRERIADGSHFIEEG